MAGGFSKDGAVQEQIDASIDDAVGQIRRRLSGGVSRTSCEACGEKIPEARQRAVAGVRFCVPCQQEEDEALSIDVGYNRRGSKGSQMR